MAISIADQASIHPQAIIEDDVEIGPFCVVGPQVRIGAGTRLENSVTLMGRVTLISATTPIEDDAVEVRFTLYHSGDPIAEKIGTGFAAEVARQFHEDIPIWEHKRYQPSPALAPSEKSVTEFRRWAAQFYAEAASVAG